MKRSLGEEEGWVKSTVEDTNRLNRVPPPSLRPPLDVGRSTTQQLTPSAPPLSGSCAHLPSATNTMASAPVPLSITGAVQPSTSPGDSGRHLGTAREGKRAPSRCLASCMAVLNWMVPARTRGLSSL